MKHFSRRKFLGKTGALLGAMIAAGFISTSAMAEDYPTAAVNTTGLAVTDDTVKVGILHSLTGTMAISETGAQEAEKLAIKQINESGGILGRQIEIIQEDGASDWPTFAEKSRKLLVNDHVAAVFGCWTSASRKAALPVFEQQNGLLYYPTFYEGLEQSHNVIYTGQEATQQILAGLDWVAKEKGAKTYYLIGSDYIWPRTSMKIARKHIENVLGGKVVGEEYKPLGDTQFGSVINKIRLKKPDVIFAAVVGGSNVAWFKQLNAAGITGDKQTLLTISVTEDEVLGIGGENLVGFYSVMKYFQSLDNDNNKAFVKAFKEMHGDDSVIGDVTQAAYLGPWLWKAAVEKAGSFDVDKVVAASEEGDIELTTAPEGYVKLHPNHHLWSYTRVAEWQKDGQAKVIYQSPELIEPNPFPEGYQ
ncbi:MAG: urea ABC transporter substrate-binding protein [Pseudomonadota bacterium]|jgi:urea transport system substrate-binding protein|uniref:ABC-type branched-chain amino acid transport system, periplasmic component n=2 Tax=Methylophaga TaxID=40222 RepID=F5SWI2_9GAMM|nr:MULTISPECIES: urea ABC transporter substrate-binding protein [Methylophaga]EGL55419.1 ABC-type branched-chain amino acid transport system, periplasmic component [Methylophaga aminisulfidivorans MP]MEC9412204.1 urea ABC transporter substrate-binding protein [Pseudomonadota bacterium]WVI86703.1 urea ABC transporter substrate-binding protein [Methylophaga thalassica]GLP98975.1 branched-chain amino acid ABC transporter substrate-binding protein [Methylophaga thalassica]